MQSSPDEYQTMESGPGRTQKSGSMDSSSSNESTSPVDAFYAMAAGSSLPAVQEQDHQLSEQELRMRAYKAELLQHHLASFTMFKEEVEQRSRRDSTVLAGNHAASAATSPRRST